MGYNFLCLHMCVFLNCIRMPFVHQNRDYLCAKLENSSYRDVKVQIRVTVPNRIFPPRIFRPVLNAGVVSK